MKKLALKLDELQVETFEVGNKVGERGTVLGHGESEVDTCGFSCICQDTVYTNNDPTCDFSCDCETLIACLSNGPGC